jgi:hypothetical protein
VACEISGVWAYNPYILIVHPATAIHELAQKDMIPEDWMDYRDRCIVTKELSYEARQSLRKRSNITPIEKRVG